MGCCVLGGFMIELKEASVRRAGRLLFSEANFALHRGQKVGLVGNNGVGKSTLFAIMRGKMTVDTGQFTIPSDWQIAHMAQEIEASMQTAIDYVLSGDKAWYALNERLTHQHHIACDEIAQLHQQFADMDGYRTPAKAAQILAGLGFADNEHQNSVASFSGGWRVRLNLARTLMHRADVLLLDEPTNHLDLDAILWLEEWLVAYEGLVVIISHDKAFLDTVVTRILHIEQGKITLYSGNYSQFIHLRNERLAQAAQAYAKQQATRAHLEDFINRFRAKATKARQAQSRIKQLERMAQLSAVVAVQPFSFEFFEPSAMSSPLIRLDNAAIGYDKPLLIKVNLTITPDVRLGVLGANGAGKSTLIKALAGELELLGGQRLVSDKLCLGYFNQHQMDALDLTATPMILLRRLAGQTPDDKLRSFLGGFGFGDKLDSVVERFSGGERARLTLALIVWQRPNVLILDEPTNHLDLDMHHALTLALQNFAGALVLVSHDRELILSVCDELMLVFEGRVASFEGDMNDYAKHLSFVRQQKQKALEPCYDKNETNKTVSKEELRKKNADIRQKTAPLRKAMIALEAKLDTLSTKLRQIEEQLGDSALYDDENKAKLLKLLEEQNTLKAQQADCEEELLRHMDELETLEQTFDESERA